MADDDPRVISRKITQWFLLVVAVIIAAFAILLLIFGDKLAK